MKLKQFAMLVVCLSMTGCWRAADSNSTFNQPHTQHWYEWYHFTADFFLNARSEQSVESLATLLEKCLSPAQSKDNVIQPAQQAEFTQLMLTTHDDMGDSAAEKARHERTLNRAKMLLTHQMTFFGELYLNQQDRELINGDEHWPRFTGTLTSLVQDHPVLKAGAMSLYEANEQTGILAYQRIDKKSRAYIVFNFSLDLHPLPLPLGFMASTKVTLWQSTHLTTRTFVTTEPLGIEALSAAIVIVN